MDAEGTAPPGMMLLRATGSVDASFARLEAAVAQRALTVFARIDFAADAAAAGLRLQPTRLLLFGNPKAGTPLIVAAPTVALDLPLKVLVWEAGDGSVWVGYDRPEYLAERHAVPAELLANVRAVEALAAIAAGTA
jgi:uncharacterized protein (DUF302 family)